MKKSLLTALLVLFALSVMGQSNAFYIYHNDGTFNTFFVSDVDSMAYSCYDANMVKHNRNVTQLIYTRDSIYRIPLAAIDSVGFAVNDIKVSNNYVSTDENGYTVVSADKAQGEYVLRFHSAVPTLKAGQVMTINNDTLSAVVKIVSVSVNGLLATIKTAQANLGNIFTSGSFSLSTASPASSRSLYFDEDGRRVFYPVEVVYFDENNHPRRVRMNDKYKVDIDQRIFSYKIDYSGEDIFKNDFFRFYAETCKVEYSLDFIASFNFTSVWDGISKLYSGDLTMEKAVIRGAVDTDFKIRVDVSGEKEEKFPVKELKLKVHKPVKVKFVVSGVPVWVTLNTDLLAEGGYKCEGNLSAHTGFAASTGVEVGCTWNQKTGLSPYGDCPTSFEFYHPTIEGNAHLEEKVSIYPRFHFHIYGVLGPVIELKPYLKQTLDFAFSKDMIAQSQPDFVSAQYCASSGIDGVVGFSTDEKMKAKSPEWNIFDLPLYEGPKKIKFVSSSSDDAYVGLETEATFLVTDYFNLFGKEVSALLPYVVKFETNCGEVDNAFAVIDASTGLVSVNWTPAAKTTDDADPYLHAILHDHEGKVISTASWQPEMHLLCCPDDNHPHKIDLGLPSGVYWSCCNVGATNPQLFGAYYSWGETKQKSTYTEWNYWDWDMFMDVRDKYRGDLAGTALDVAAVEWGEYWRMPSDDEWNELLGNTRSRWTTYQGHKGLLFTGENGNNIFIPAAGYCYGTDVVNPNIWGDYWSSTLGPNDEEITYYFIFNNRGRKNTTTCQTPYWGCSVRPISW